MNLFAKIKNFLKKLLIVITLVSSISVVAPKPVAASIGGELMEPICDFLVFIGDGIINIIHKVVLEQDLALLRIDKNEGLIQKLRIGAAIAAIAIVAVVATVVTGGVAAIVGGTTFAAAVAANIGAIAVVTLVGGGYAAAKVYNNEWWNNEVVLPLYSITPETIFRNDEHFPLFDVNFFNPKDAYVTSRTVRYADGMPKDSSLYSEDSQQNSRDDNGNAYTYAEYTEMATIKGSELDQYLQNNIGARISDFGNTDNIDAGGQQVQYYEDAVNNKKYSLVDLGDQDFDGDPEYKLSVYDPATANTSGGQSAGNNSGTEEIYIYPISYQISDFIARAYYVLLTIATVAMMSILVYVGIRILLSATAPQKAKYKQLCWDWLVGMVLLFSMHIIMVFLNDFVAEINNFFNSINPSVDIALVPDPDNKITNALAKENIIENQDYQTQEIEGVKHIAWPTNLSGMIRIQLQNYSKDDADKYFGYTMMFLTIIFMTLFFTWTYIKRIIYLAFLTLIAPIVAITYPIDKVNDGKAQGFNYWFKEYVFNLLLQPLHLLLYTVLVSLALEMAAKNWLYSLVALGFIATAEKIVRRMFNFQKAETPGVFAGPAGAAMTLSAIRWLSGRAGSKGALEDNKKNQEKQNRITTAKSLESTSETLKDFKEKDIKQVEVQNSNVTESSIDAGMQGGPQNIVVNVSEVREGNDGNKQLEQPEYRDKMAAVDKELAGQNVQVDNNNNNNVQVQAGTEYKNPVAPQEHIVYVDNSRTDIKGNIKTDTATNTEDPTKRGFWGSIAEAGSTYIDGQGRKLKEVREDIAQNGMKKLTKKTTGAIVGATLGTVGLAAGIASGDLKNVTTLGAAGGAAGYKVGSEKAGSAINKLTVEEAGEAYKKARLGQKEYAEREAAKYQKELAESEDTIRTIQDQMKLTRKEAKKKAKQMIKEYVDAKVTDVSEMVKIEKFRNQYGKVENNKGEPRELTRKEASQIAKMVTVYNMQQKDGQKERNAIINRMQKNMDINEPTAIRFETMTRDYMKFRDS